MPDALQPQIIQDNAINGIIKVIERVNGKFNEYLNQLRFEKVTK